MKKMKKIIAIALCAFMLAIPLSSCSDAACASNGYSRFGWLGRIISDGCSDVMNGKFSALIEKIFSVNNNNDQQTTTSDGSDADIETEDDSQINKSFAEEVLDLCNAERAKLGLRALVLDDNLCIGAQMKSEDMASKGYFSHTSPIYGSPFDMMKSRGITYRRAGENIAKGYKTPEEVVTGWMNSEGHRANILNSDFGKLGVGYVSEGNYWTQWFTD